MLFPLAQTTAVGESGLIMPLHRAHVITSPISPHFRTGRVSLRVLSRYFSLVRATNLRSDLVPSYCLEDARGVPRGLLTVQWTQSERLSMLAAAVARILRRLARGPEIS